MTDKIEKGPEEHPGIKPDRMADWMKFVEESIGNDPGEPRNYALLLLAQVSTMIKGLDQGLAPIEVLKLVQPNTTFVMMSPLLQVVMTFSVRGAEFRLWWNEWHDRVNPGDVPDIPVEQMTLEQRKKWDARWFVETDDGPRERPPVFNPWQIHIVGKVAQLVGTFDPSEPLTKSPKYMENVNALYKKMKEDATATTV